MSTNTPALGRCPAGRKLPGKERGRHRSHLGASTTRQLQGRFSWITISDLPRLSPVLGTQSHQLAETAIRGKRKADANSTDQIKSNKRGSNLQQLLISDPTGESNISGAAEAQDGDSVATHRANPGQGTPGPAEQADCTQLF